MTPAQSFQMLRDRIQEGIEKSLDPDYVPTGLQEEIIYWVGSGKYEIVVALHSNDTGKTTAGANICRNIIWPHDQNYFSFWDGTSIFRDKKFELKTFRIGSDPKHLMETAAIHTEIKNWWPKNRYEWTKGGQEFPSQCKCDNGWTGDALSYNQPREAFESKKVSFAWWDEPGRPDLIGAMTSRFATDGMLWFITATPIRAGAFLDVINDLCDKGTKVKLLSGTADDNSIEHGMPNHLGTKRGLRTEEQIRIKKSSCPPDEYDARILGKTNYKSGRIYYDFDRNFHVQDYDLSSQYFKKANCFTTIDIHGKAYPFVQMWALTEDDIFIQYNEWPTFEELGNNYYDETRQSLICNYDIESLSRFVKIYEGTRWGLHVIGRWMDPRAGKNSDGQIGSPESLMVKFSKYGLKFDLPPFELIEVQRDRIRNLLKHDVHNPVERPRIVIMPHNVSSIRMLERHYWEEEKEKESERYKEGPDCMRIMFAGLRDRKFTPVIDEGIIKKNNVVILNPVISKMKEMAGISLG